MGTFCALDCHTPQDRDNILQKLRNKGTCEPSVCCSNVPLSLSHSLSLSLSGFYLGGAGNQTIRFRPALIFKPEHAHLFLEGFEETLKELN